MINSANDEKPEQDICPIYNIINTKSKHTSYSIRVLTRHWRKLSQKRIQTPKSNTQSCSMFMKTNSTKCQNEFTGLLLTKPSKPLRESYPSIQEINDSNQASKKHNKYRHIHYQPASIWAQITIIYHSHTMQNPNRIQRLSNHQP